MLLGSVAGNGLIHKAVGRRSSESHAWLASAMPAFIVIEGACSETRTMELA